MLRKTIIILLAMTALVMGGFAVHSEEAEHRYIRLEFQPHSSSVVFDIQVFANGMAIFHGESDSKEIGYRAYHVKPGVFEQAAEILNSDLFRSYGKLPCDPSEYTPFNHGTLLVIEDRSRVSVFGKQGWTPKIVKDKWLCPAEKSRAFADMFYKLGELFEVDRFAGTAYEQDAIGICRIMGHGSKKCIETLRERSLKASPEWKDWPKPRRR